MKQGHILHSPRDYKLRDVMLMTSFTLPTTLYLVNARDRTPANKTPNSRNFNSEQDLGY
jgi:hypothetical protein